MRLKKGVILILLLVITSSTMLNIRVAAFSDISGNWAEAAYVLSLMDGYQMTGPIAYDWEICNSAYRAYHVAPKTATDAALDIVALSYQMLDCKQANTAEQKWLAANSYKYGFLLRYPENKTDITGIGYEPWHYRYVSPHCFALFDII